LLASANSSTGTPTRGNQEGENPSNVYMMSSHVDIPTWSRDYGELESSKAKSTLDVSEPLHIKRPVVEPIPRMPKGFAKRSTINPNAKAA